MYIWNDINHKRFEKNIKKNGRHQLLVKKKISTTHFT